MPRNVAQWTGVAVTMIVVLGRDADVLTAVPLGIVAGMLAMLFQEAMRTELRPAGLALAAAGLRWPGTAAARVCRQFRPKQRHAQFQE